MARVPTRLLRLHENDMVRRTLDRGSDFGDVLRDALEFWRVDLEARQPAPAYMGRVDDLPISPNPEFDMFTFLCALADRRAVINIPEYMNMRPLAQSSHQEVVSRQNRHGQVRAVRGNKETMAFSVGIRDYNVIDRGNNRERVGAPRNFAIVNDAGEWREEWHSLEFMPTAIENAFLEDNELYEGDAVDFEYFVQPDLRFAIYGLPYMISRILLDRVTDQARFFRRLARTLRDEGVKLPPRTGGPAQNAEDEIHGEIVGPSRRERFLTLETRLVAPFEGEYVLRGMEGRSTRKYARMPDSYSGRQKVLRYAEYIARRLSFTYGPQLRAGVRAVELAFLEYGLERGERSPNEVRPEWEVPEWEPVRVKRTDLHEVSYGSIKLQHRLFERSVEVNGE